VTTTIKIHITANDGSSTTTHTVHSQTEARPAACIASLAGMLDRYGWAAPESVIRLSPGMHEKLADAHGLDPCEIDEADLEHVEQDEFEARALEIASKHKPVESPTQPTGIAHDSLAGFDLAGKSGAAICKAVGASNSVTLIERVLHEERSRADLIPKMAVRQAVIGTCRLRLSQLEGEGEGE
jgi:hypothetical protein